MKVNVTGKGVIPGLKCLAPVYGQDLSEVQVRRIIAFPMFRVYNATTGKIITRNNVSKMFLDDTPEIKPMTVTTATAVVETKQEEIQPVVKEETPVEESVVEEVPVIEETPVPEVIMEEQIFEPVSPIEEEPIVEQPEETPTEEETTTEETDEEEPKEETVQTYGNRKRNKKRRS